MADPNVFLFKGAFEQPAVNGSGDVVFPASALHAKKRLYLYPAASAASVVAEVAGAAPGGGVFTRIDVPTINDAADVAFLGDLNVGEAVFLQPSGGPLAAVRRNGDAAPGGGTFVSFTELSTLNAVGDLAFLATVSGGPSGAFRHQPGSSTTSAIALVGDATGDGRLFCGFTSVELGDSGHAVLHATTKLDCLDLGETARDGIYQQTGTGFLSVAQHGDATPVAGTTYTNFYGVPEINASDVVGFRAKSVGITTETGLFDFDPSGPTSTRLIATGEIAPGAGGPLRMIARAHLTDAARQAFRGRVRGGTLREGIFLVGGSGEPVVLANDQVPNDVFGAGATYRRIDEDFDVDRTGTKVVFSGKVRDTVAPHSATAIFRCSGS
jgi:hypothetical protein